jgi:hypothetical protein
MLAADVISNWQAEVDRVDAMKRDSNLPTSDTEFVITHVTRISRTWCVFYNNRRYIETGEISHALAGNGPVLVSDEGVVDVAGTAFPTAHYVAEFEATD